jgi:Transglutaminase-like superfamily
MVVYTIRRTGRPFFPGEFFSGGFFQRGFAFEDARINVTLPKATAARVEAQGVEHRVTEGERTTTHSFLYRNPQPPVAEATGLSAWDTDPRFIISTFADYAAVAAAYRAQAATKAVVTPRIQALANDITAGASDRREQAHRIYDWVSEHIRYVAVFLGNGGYVPHDAVSILDSGYGDCKDHVVVLEALLKAKGIASIPVLINSGNRYGAPEAATPALFNHVLSYLPEFDLYADSTVGVAPFGTLPADEYGKTVARADETGASLMTLPLVAAPNNEEKLQTTAILMADGTVSGRSITTARGRSASGFASSPPASRGAGTGNGLKHISKISAGAARRVSNSRRLAGGQPRSMSCRHPSSSSRGPNSSKARHSGPPRGSGCWFARVSTCSVLGRLPKPRRPPASPGIRSRSCCLPYRPPEILSCCPGARP